jgi:glycosyltransferase involved in cell wall biosynthesis
MKVCLVAEGCYPYVVGGVSGWIHSLIRLFPRVEFSLIAIVSDRSVRGKFIYDLPENLVSVTEVYLNDLDWDLPGRAGKLRLSRAERAALRSLAIGRDIDWEGVFRLFSGKRLSVDRLLMSPDFYDIVRDYYLERYHNVTFSDFLWTMRSIYLTLFLALKAKPPKADVYHCVSTGYAGIIGSMAKVLNPGSAMLISEHGIYTREREEEIIKAKWVTGIYKDIWIEQFRKMSRCAYRHADIVTALFQKAHELQVELDCPPEKAVVTPNGIDVRQFENIPQKDPDDPHINVGALLRVTPIKDVKTMISAFYYARRENPALKLWIMGPDDEDPGYAEECRQLAKSLGEENIVFTGRIRTAEYVGKMDMTLLTSISEGQPLTILESFAAKKPVIATNVGNCMGLICGEADDLGPAGIVCSVLNIGEIAQAILKLAADAEARVRMGEIGYKRLMLKYKSEDMTKAYLEIYQRLARVAGIEYPGS